MGKNWLEEMVNRAKSEKVITLTVHSSNRGSVNSGYELKEHSSIFNFLNSQLLHKGI